MFVNRVQNGLIDAVGDAWRSDQATRQFACGQCRLRNVRGSSCSSSESLVNYRESDLLAGDMLEVYVVNGYQGVSGSVSVLG